MVLDADLWQALGCECAWPIRRLGMSGTRGQKPEQCVKQGENNGKLQTSPSYSGLVLEHWQKWQISNPTLRHVCVAEGPAASYGSLKPPRTALDEELQILLRVDVDGGFRQVDCGHAALA